MGSYVYYRYNNVAFWHTMVDVANIEYKLRSGTHALKMSPFPPPILPETIIHNWIRRGVLNTSEGLEIFYKHTRELPARENEIFYRTNMTEEELFLTIANELQIFLIDYEA